MNKYDLIGKAEVVITTSVYARSLEEAIEFAKNRDIECCSWDENDNQEEEVWTTDLIVKNIQDVREDK